VFELTEARARGLVVVPVLVGGARMPPAALLPPVVRPIAQLAGAHVRPESWRDRRVRVPRATARPERRRRQRGFDGVWTITAHQQQSVKYDAALFTVT
jgi:hypothetical protein